MADQPGSVAIVGAGDFIGAAIARRFAAGGFHVHGGRRQGDKLDALARRDRGGWRAIYRPFARRAQRTAIAAFLDAADADAPLAVCIFNIGANVNFPLLETTERVFRKVWEMACYAGFLTGREAARRMLAHGGGSIFFTGATASLRGGSGYAAFASAKAGLRAAAQSMARELGPQEHPCRASGDRRRGRHRLGARADRRGQGRRGAAELAPDSLVDPASIAEAYWQLHRQPRDAWTHELDLRPFGERW